MEAESSSKKRATFNDYGFMDLIFSWSIEDILDEEFYKKKVCTIFLCFIYINGFLSTHT
jgi:hypothetical protein